MTAPRVRQARDVVRKLSQASGHAQALQDRLAEGDWDGAWEAAVHLKKTTAAARHLVDRFERDEKHRGPA